MDKFLKVKDVAEALSVSMQTIRREIGNGNISAIRVGNQLRISEIELKAYFTRKGSPANKSYIKTRSYVSRTHQSICLKI